MIPPDELQKLEALIGYSFRHAEFLEEALTHRSSRSAGNRGPADNERLEFLGDRVLGLVVSQHLYESFSEWDVGHLSKGLSRLVSAASIQAAAASLGLGEYLRLGRGEELTGGRAKPNLLADAYEAVVAAIYLDGGLDAAGAFIQRTLFESDVVGERNGWSEPDHKSALQEWLQERGLGIPQYRVVRETGPDHCKVFSVELWLQGSAVAESDGRTKKEAEQGAARVALSRLREERSGSAPVAL